MTGSPVTYSLREIADRFGGEIVGDPEVRVARVATLEGAGAASIAFLANPRYLKQLADIGVLKEVVVGREKLFIHPKLVHLLTRDSNRITPYS